MLLINAPLIDLWENSLFTEKLERSEIPKLTGQVSLIYTLYTTCKQTYTVTNRHFHPPAPLHCPSQTTASPSHSSPPPSPYPSTPSAESCPPHSWGSRLQTALRPSTSCNTPPSHPST